MQLEFQQISQMSTDSYLRKSASVMWSLEFKKGWEKWNQGSIVSGQWVKVKTLTGATRETLEDFVGVILRFCV